MSSIHTTQVDGDVAVGRNVAIGGKADVQGSVTIGHNLKVKGWLDADKIKNNNKGVFLTMSDLATAYPIPQPGWYAGVVDAGSGSSSTVYIKIYSVDAAGAWTPTKKVVEMPIDASAYAEGVEQLEQDLQDLAAEVETLTNTDVANPGPITANTRAINSLKAEIGDTATPGSLKYRMSQVETTAGNAADAANVANAAAGTAQSGGHGARDRRQCYVCCCGGLQDWRAGVASTLGFFPRHHS